MGLQEDFCIVLSDSERLWKIKDIIITENICKYTEKPLGDHQRCQSTIKKKMDSKQNNLRK